MLLPNKADAAAQHNLLLQRIDVTNAYAGQVFNMPPGLRMRPKRPIDQMDALPSGPDGQIRNFVKGLAGP